MILRVLETGSLLRTVDRLDLSKSIVSLRLGNLEATLEARLVIRRARPR